ncbi:MAG: alpha-glucan family phosphorylase [Candidatus Dojkabacteria bacterium]
MSNDSFFHAYDVRGIYPDELNADAAYKVAHAYFSKVEGERYVIGYDMRESSPELFRAFVRAANDLGRRVDSTGMTTTDMVYFVLGKHEYDGGIMITASHNPKLYNGIKMMGKGVAPVDMEELKGIYNSLDVTLPADFLEKDIEFSEKDYSDDYVAHMMGLVDVGAISPLKVVVDAGNGMGGVTAAKVFAKLDQIEVVEMYFEPNASFPHHEANPTIPDNTKELAAEVVKRDADYGIAFDGDGDRCVFVDENGEAVPGHLMVALFTKIMLAKQPGAKIAYDHRNVYAIRYELEQGNGIGLPVRAGHSFFKELMHNEDALFGGESSSHFYFKDNFYADSGALPYLLIFEYLSKEKLKMSEVLAFYRGEFYASGEMNFLINGEVDPNSIYEALKEAFRRGKYSDPDGLVMEFDSWRLNARPSNTEPIMRVNVEAVSQSMLDKMVLKVHEEMSKFGRALGNLSSREESDIDMTVEDRFEELMNNLWFTWNPHYILPVIDLYGDGWRKNSPPGEFMSQYGKKKFESILDDKAWEIDQNVRLMRDYLDSEHDVWFHRYCTEEECFLKLDENPIAYFSLEYGLVDWLQIYSGGLGVLAGDFIKQASDMGVPLVAIGIFYHEGYFHQDFDESGAQLETYIHQNPDDYHMELLKDEGGNQLEIEIEIVDHIVWVRAWKLSVGNVPLILLDTDFEKNEREEDRMITAHLYGGDQDTRIRQEILLGIGGSRMLDALGYKPSLYHMNEGHSGFLVFEIARKYMNEKDMSFKEALEEVDEQLVFTNHTLKQAGNDIFPYLLIQRYLSPYLDDLQTDINTIFDLGKDEIYAQGEFSMTILGLRNAKISNAVSLLHGVAAKKIWPEYNLVPITNGVHMPTWVAPEIHRLLDKYVGENWHYPNFEVDYKKVQKIPHDELWSAHLVRKEKLINSLNNSLDTELDPEALTIAWSRRLASYKRPDLITSDLARLEECVSRENEPLQVLIAGKAHPRDSVGKELVQKMNASLKRESFKNKVVIVPGYNWQLARRMVSGADVWLNTPYRFEEASGTSGMKAAANGVLQFTTKDGWTDEVDWYQKGWVISDEHPAKSLHDTLADKVLPFYFDRNAQGLNPRWIQMMLNSMELVLSHYSTGRMMSEYLEKIYMPILKRS